MPSSFDDLCNRVQVQHWETLRIHICDKLPIVLFFAVCILKWLSHIEANYLCKNPSCTVKFFHLHLLKNCFGQLILSIPEVEKKQENLIFIHCNRLQKLWPYETMKNPFFCSNACKNKKKSRFTLTKRSKSIFMFKCMQK